MMFARKFHMLILVPTIAISMSSAQGQNPLAGLPIPNLDQLLGGGGDIGSLPGVPGFGQLFGGGNQGFGGGMPFSNQGGYGRGGPLSGILGDGGQGGGGGPLAGLGLGGGDQGGSGGFGDLGGRQGGFGAEDGDFGGLGFPGAGQGDFGSGGIPGFGGENGLGEFSGYGLQDRKKKK